MRRDPIPRLPENNRIDELVWAKLEKMGIVPERTGRRRHVFAARLSRHASARCRRRTKSGHFWPTPRPTSGRGWIDTLLERSEYADYWALKWSDILLVDRNRLADRGAFELHRWLREQFARNRPYDEWVRELVTASGNSGTSGPANFYRARRHARSGGPRRSARPSGRADGVCPVPPPPVREMVAGRFLRTGRLLQRHGAKAARRRTGCWSTTPAISETRMPRNEPVGRRREPLRRRGRRTIDERRSARRAGRLDDAAGEPVVRPAGRQPAVEALLRPRPGRTGRRSALHEPGHERAAARLTWPSDLVARTIRPESRHAADPELARRISLSSVTAPDQRGRRAELFAPLRRAVCRPR